MPVPSASPSAFRDVLSSSRRIVAVAGAGLSAASGIPTFRGAGGMWRKYDAIELATPEGFADNPSLVWQFYHYRRETARKAAPNAAHTALALFSVPEIRHAVAPDSTFTLVTQNVDNLSPRAIQHVLADRGIDPAALPQSPPHLIEMHGRLFDVKCTECDHVEFNTDSPICAGLAGTEQLVANNVLDPDIPQESLPRCSACNALARPGVVWFGETPHKMGTISKLVKSADLCLVIGTSSTVWPAAGYASQVAINGGKVAVFNYERTSGDDSADFLFLGKCEELLPQALCLQDLGDGTGSAGVPAGES